MIRKLFKAAFGALLTFGAFSANTATVVLNGGTGGSSCTYSAVAFASDGTMTVTCSGGSSGLTSQSISFGAAPTGVTVGGATGTVSATATSGLAVTFASSTTSICTVSGTTVTGVAAGSCTVTANQAGNSTYAAAASVAQSFSVASASAGGCQGGAVTANLGSISVTNVTTKGPSLISGTATYQFTLPTAEVMQAANVKSWDMTYLDTTYPAGGMSTSISTCAGDFGTSVVSGCNFPFGTSDFNFAPVGTPNRTCLLERGKTYYYNVRSLLGEFGLLLEFVPNRYF